MNDYLWRTAFIEAENWRMMIAFVLGVLVGIIYFKSLQWSINRLGDSKYAMRKFAFIAVLRIALFFGALVLIANHNIAVILIYILAFFFTKTAIMWREKRKNAVKEMK